MNVVVLSRGVKVIPGPGQKLDANTREARTCGGRQDAYLYFGQAGEFAGENSTRIELWWAATAQAYLNFGQVECCPCSQRPGSDYQWRWKG
jgi:hypothetical protein